VPIRKIVVEMAYFIYFYAHISSETMIWVMVLLLLSCGALKSEGTKIKLSVVKAACQLLV